MKVPIWLVALAPLSACASEAAPVSTPPVSVAIVSPTEGAVINDTVRIQLSATGIAMVAATGQRKDGEGHHHLFIDVDPTPDTVMIPKDERIRHLGTGADTVSLVLSPGTHRIIAVAAWGDHVPVAGARRDTVTFEVRSSVTPP
jgi:hypothetical protein